MASGVGDWKNAYQPMLARFFPERLMTGYSLPELLDLICAVDLAPEYRALLTRDHLESRLHAVPMRQVTLEAIRQALANGTLDPARVEAALERIRAFRSRLP